jgi:hypothetical protein
VPSWAGRTCPSLGRNRRAGCGPATIFSSASPGSDLCQFDAEDTFRDLGIVRRLSPQPVTIGKTEKSAQTQIGIGRDAPLAGHDVADALRRHADFLGQPILADAHRFQKLLQQEFTGSYGAELGHHNSPSMVVHDLDILGTCVRPPKANPILIVDPDTVLARSIAFQGLQPIARRHTQIIQSGGDFKLPELAPRNGCDIREALDPLSLGESLGVGALESLNHASR